MRKRALVFLLLLAAIAPRLLWAQSAASPQPTIRYHYGDNPAWASPSFDDSSWAVAVNGQLSGPRFHSGGYLWIRARVPVPSGLAGPLGVQAQGAMQDTGV